MKRLAGFLMVMTLLSASAQAQTAPREVALLHTMSGPIGSLRFAGAGPGMGVSTLQSLSFALEYDPDLIDVQELESGSLLQDFPPDGLQIDHQRGRVEVAITYDVPIPVDATVNSQLFTVYLGYLDDFYQGERVIVRTVGSAPGEPVQWIDDTQNPDDIKVTVQNKVIIGNSGITCLGGDALGDGEIDAGDSGTVLRIVTEIIEAPDVAMRCGSDLNQDGNIYAGDAVLILRRAAGFEDFIPRLNVDPQVEFIAAANGARLRIAGADFAHGATVRLRAVGAVRIDGIATASTALAARRVEDEDAVIALADLRTISGGDGVLEFLIEADGAGRIVIDELSLYGANGDALFEYSGPLKAELSGPPSAVALALGNTPNPFNPSTTFWMDIPQDGRVVLELFDIRGRKLATLLDEDRLAGRSDYRFDGRVAGGELLASGVYFARLNTGVGSTVHRVTLLK